MLSTPLLPSWLRSSSPIRPVEGGGLRNCL
jgi:hypothetical protein